MRPDTTADVPGGHGEVSGDPRRARCSSDHLARPLLDDGHERLEAMYDPSPTASSCSARVQERARASGLERNLAPGVLLAHVHGTSSGAVVSPMPPFSSRSRSAGRTTLVSSSVRARSSAESHHGESNSPCYQRGCQGTKQTSQWWSTELYQAPDGLPVVRELHCWPAWTPIWALRGMFYCSGLYQ